jgi:phage-related protein
MEIRLKPITWVGTARTDLHHFPKAARSRAGNEIYRLQTGSEPRHWRPMSSVGSGVCEIKIRENGEFRIIYLVPGSSGPVILHCFAKKTRQTSKADIKLARQRLKALDTN